MKKTEYAIYGDNLIEAEWFRGLSPTLEAVPYFEIGRRGSNPSKIDSLVTYDRPDIILVRDDNPVLVVEKTREVPTGHNVGQRFARLVRAVEHGIVTIKFFPFDARKHGIHTGICNMNVRLLDAFEKMRIIHNVPVVAVNWPTDNEGELRDDGSEDERMKAIVHEFMLNGHDPNGSQIQLQRNIMQEERDNRIKVYPGYNKPPKSVKSMDTKALLERWGNPEGETFERMAQAAHSIVYEIGMKPEKCRREDPYTGTQFIYDYVWCRSGPSAQDKHTNLVLHFPLITRNHWAKKNPNNPLKKSCNWYLTANALWFKDDIQPLR
jgi:hypothetical protein